MKQRIWIDVTDMVDWNGHLTGIQRVVYQIAKRYDSSTHHDAHFFIYHEAERIFTEIDLNVIRKQVEMPPPQAYEQGAQGWKHLLKNVPKELFRRLPPKVKERIPHSVKHGLKQAYHHAILTAKKSKYELEKRVRLGEGPSLTPITFAKDDVVLALGKVWDKVNLTPDLAAQKRHSGFKMVYLIHDMIPSMQPQLFGPGLFEPYTRTMFEAFQVCDLLLTNSRSSKSDILAFCQQLAINPPPITVVRLGDEYQTTELPADFPLPDHRLKPGNFILQVGTVEVRKNHLLTYQAYREAAIRGETDFPYWVITGGRGWLIGDILHQIQYDPLVKDKVILLWGPSDDVLLCLYKHCRFTVFPSTYEGWGMPVSESLAYGKACITSTTSSLPEAGAGLADLVSPYNAGELYDRIRHYLNDKTLRAQEKKIATTYKPATWDDMFQQCEAAIVKHK